MRQSYTQKVVKEGLRVLGYPLHFVVELGIWKFLGAVALLVPGFRLLKEWAYAGFEITLISAVVSHYASGDGLKSLDPLFFLLVLTVSYLTRPASRSLLVAGTGR